MMFWTKFLNENMSIDEILSGMDSKGKPARIAMPLSSLKADSDGISALDRLRQSVREGYRYLQVSMAADEDYEKIHPFRLKDENGQPYSESTLRASVTSASFSRSIRM